MYIASLFDENIGPIEDIHIDFPLTEDGFPKPIIFVGENGSGKSTLLSNIVDAFYTIAATHFSNVMPDDDKGPGQRYYKAINPSEIQIGKRYLYAYMTFDNNPPIQYMFKAGMLSFDEFKGIRKKLYTKYAMPFEIPLEGGSKTVNLNGVDVEKIFQTDVICYFGPDRYEKPIWMVEKYIDDNLHPSVRPRIAGVLNNPISVKSVTGTNLQWLMDIIVDSRSDVEMADDGGLILGGFHTETLWGMGKARRNLETILGQILWKDVRFSVPLRNHGISRFNIVEAKTNNVIVPTLDSLSAGQIALFNMFSTIVRYADNNDLSKSIALENISGIVVIDEIELHLHASLQKEVLPKLIKLFPQVQFIITSHAPLFLLGMQETFGDDGFEVYEMPTATKISVERFSEFQRAYDYIRETQTYQKEAEAAIEKAKARLTSKVMIITEGASDWKHMKTAMTVLKDKPEYAEVFAGLEFEFFEYEPGNPEMGYKTLMQICKNYADMPHDGKYLFIADRDVEEANNFFGNDNGRFKKRSKSVYSFLIPVPAARQDTPEICIEHLYSDSEIKTEVEINGVKRRLYMGNEFDSRGLATDINRFCKKANVCGPGKIDIIEGTQKDRITSISNSEGVDNYALSKMNFAKYVSEHPDQFNFDNFVELFKIIKEIIADGAL